MSTLLSPTTKGLALAVVLVSLSCSGSDSPQEKRDAAPPAADSAVAVADARGDTMPDTAVAAPDVVGADAPVDASATVEPEAGAVDAAAVMADAVADVSEEASLDVAPARDVAPDAVEKCGRILCDCTSKGKKLFGEMNYVTNFPYDFKVEVVTNNFADLYVQELTNAGFPSRCGQWKTDSFVPTFRVLKVTAPTIPDFTIQYDNLLPGIPGRRF